MNDQTLIEHAPKPIRTILNEKLFEIHGVEVSLLVLIGAAVIILASVVFARLVTRFLKRNVFSRAHVSVGAQESISRVLHYVIMTLGVFMALNYVGLDLTGLAAVGAILGVGIGFGLQNLANNFVSGLVLLFERPIQVGDFVEVAGVLGSVRAINARSTTVVTQDNVSIIVPNSQFISQNVTNWSYRDSRTRIHVRVGVAYRSDVKLVEATLLEVAKSHDKVLPDPQPRVQFLRFGDSALEFDLLIWIADPTQQYIIRSDLNFAIVQAFRECHVEIPFPQRDLHLRSADGVTLVPGMTKKSE